MRSIRVRGTPIHQPEAGIEVTGSIAYIPAAKGDTINGTYTKPIELASGRYAIIEQSQEFNLVPWRSVLERSRNQLVTGKVGGSGISWQIGKRRGIGR
uniref:DUF3363 domain-containing protein n=1 Tax=OCS116 cluster bacterium TaxID=2030921 RepID=A0A2A4Z871_9PROT